MIQLVFDHASLSSPSDVIVFPTRYSYSVFEQFQYLKDQLEMDVSTLDSTIELHTLSANNNPIKIVYHHPDILRHHAILISLLEFFHAVEKNDREKETELLQLFCKSYTHLYHLADVLTFLNLSKRATIYLRYQIAHHLGSMAEIWYKFVKSMASFIDKSIEQDDDKNGENGEKMKKKPRKAQNVWQDVPPLSFLSLELLRQTLAYIPIKSQTRCKEFQSAHRLLSDLCLRQLTEFIPPSYRLDVTVCLPMNSKLPRLESCLDFVAAIVFAMPVDYYDPTDETLGHTTLGERLRLTDQREYHEIQDKEKVRSDIFHSVLLGSMTLSNHVYLYDQHDKQYDMSMSGTIPAHIEFVDKIMHPIFPGVSRWDVVYPPHMIPGKTKDQQQAITMDQRVSFFDVKKMVISIGDELSSYLNNGFRYAPIKRRLDSQWRFRYANETMKDLHPIMSTAIYNHLNYFTIYKIYDLPHVLRAMNHSCIIELPGHYELTVNLAPNVWNYIGQGNTSNSWIVDDLFGLLQICVCPRPLFVIPLQQGKSAHIYLHLPDRIAKVIREGEEKKIVGNAYRALAKKVWIYEISEDLKRQVAELLPEVEEIINEIEKEESNRR